MPYELHPIKELRVRFESKPWQGNDPTKARFLFVGLDANYGKINEMLKEILDYHDDGVRYWKTKRVHHPFMLSCYQGDGKRYHKKFSELGFTPEDAELVSFVELLHLPTTGRSKLEPSDLSPNHLHLLANIFDRGSAKHVFLPRSVANLMMQTKHFSWLHQGPKRMDGDISVLREQNDQTIYQVYHLSCYGYHLSKLNRQINQIREIIQTYKDGKPENGG